MKLFEKKNLSQKDIKLFSYLVEKYISKNSTLSPLITDQDFIKKELTTTLKLFGFLIIVRQSYLSSLGDQAIFKKNLFKEHPLCSHLFNILIIPSIPTPKLITFSPCDKILVQLIFSWCIYLHKTIELKRVFQIVDEVNGDYVLN